MGIHERLFGRWQDKSIEQAAELNVPGLYFLAARTFGLKGLLGGTHSWLTHVDHDMKHTVIEVTSIETLNVQGSGFYYGYNGMPNYEADIEEHRVFVSDRRGDQAWFGHAPEVVYIGPMELEPLLDWTGCYPKLDHAFNVLKANCNTFTSWILHLIGVELWIGIGAKNWSKLAK